MGQGVCDTGLTSPLNHLQTHCQEGSTASDWICLYISRGRSLVYGILVLRLCDSDPASTRSQYWWEEINSSTILSSLYCQITLLTAVWYIYKFLPDQFSTLNSLKKSKSALRIHVLNLFIHGRPMCHVVYSQPVSVVSDLIQFKSWHSWI